MGEPRVWNLRDKHRVRIPRSAVYCGRGTPYGNPFIAGQHGSREHVIKRFVEEVLPTLDVSALRGKHLLCWCAPLPCHCDHILLKANSIGYEEGDICGRHGCPGIMEIEIPYCSCATGGAPCHGCMMGIHCPVCGIYSGPDGDAYYCGGEFYYD